MLHCTITRQDEVLGDFVINEKVDAVRAVAALESFCWILGLNENHQVTVKAINLPAVDVLV